MSSNKCLVCGSSNLRADRALSGRLVCNSCGIPFGVRRRGKKQINYLNISSLNIKYYLFFFILMIAFILVII